MREIVAKYILVPNNERAIDKAVLEFKRISREYKIPVIAVSSFNMAK